MCTEFDACWVAGMIQRLDYAFGRESTYDAERNINQLKPSEYVRRNVFFSVGDDRAAVLGTPLFGEDNFIWGGDYPHHVTTWPYSRETLTTICEGFPASLARKLGRDDAVRVYNLDL